MAGSGGWGAVPGFGAAEEGDADVAVELEGVACGGDGAAVGVAGFRVVEMAVGEMVGVTWVEAGADDEAAEGAVAEAGVGVLFVGGFGGGGGDLDDGEADGVVCGAGAAGSYLDDGAGGGCPIATDAGGGRGEGGGGGEKKGEGDETHGDSAKGEDIARVRATSHGLAVVTSMPP